VTEQFACKYIITDASFWVRTYILSVAVPCLDSVSAVRYTTIRFCTYPFPQTHVSMTVSRVPKLETLCFSEIQIFIPSDCLTRLYNISCMWVCAWRLTLPKLRLKHVSLKTNADYPICPLQRGCIALPALYSVARIWTPEYGVRFISQPPTLLILKLKYHVSYYYH
jgi:hypothetical protein